jgi:hypothetical protein
MPILGGAVWHSYTFYPYNNYYAHVFFGCDHEEDGDFDDTQ